MARRRGRFDRRSLAGSIAVHAGIVVLAVLSSGSARPPLEFVTYQIELVSPPPTVEAEAPRPAEEELVVERPDPVPPEPEEEPEATLEQEEQQPEPEVTQADPVEEPVEAATDDPEEDPRESGEDINVRLEGVRRDYPAYYNNIITQIHRCFRWTGQGSWETTVKFVIREDGSVSDLDFVKKSGNTTFDFEAMGAVDCAGRGRFGPLPEELPFEVLPVQFNFRPTGGVRGVFPDATTATGEDVSES
jgi:hypothetical protein